MIDPALKAAGWGVALGSRIMREYRITEGEIEAGKRYEEKDFKTPFGTDLFPNQKIRLIDLFDFKV